MASAVRSSSQDDTTLPRRHTSAMSAIFRSKRSSSGSVSEAAVAQDVEAFGERLHHAVFDAVMDHLHEVPRARRPRMDIALLGPWIVAPRGRGVRSMVPMPGARVEKIGSRCCTASVSPPIIRQ